jgi:hypothetical protein
LGSNRNILPTCSWGIRKGLPLHRRNQYIIKSLRHPISPSSHYHIISSSHYHITPSSHHHIISSPHHLIITLSHHHIITLSHYRAYTAHEKRVSVSVRAGVMHQPQKFPVSNFIP